METTSMTRLELDDNFNSTFEPTRGINNFVIDAILEKTRRNFSQTNFTILVAAYSFLILFGSAGNFLVVLSVLRNKQMRTVRNIFIVNLAISDLLLCLVTMPLTLIEIHSKKWILGETPVLCRLTGSLQGLSIFVSTISILAIAVDRYQLIVGCPVKDNIQCWGAVCVLILIWIIAGAFSAPCYFTRKLEHFNFNITELDFKHKFSYCHEDWPYIMDINAGVLYSLFTVFVQYFIPTIVLSAAYMKIYFRLKKRIVISNAANITDERIQNRLQNRGRRMKRTNCLLISIFLIFAISWLPMNIFNIYVDWTEMAMSGNIYIIYAVCHMMGMSSACSNPLLYGWLNDNFRKEFKELLSCFKRSGSRGRGTSSALKLKAIDASFAGQKRTLSEVGDIDKQSKLLLRPHCNNNEATEMKSEYTFVE